MNTTRLVPNGEVPPGERRSAHTGRNRAGTLITHMSIDLDTGRIALCSPEGPPVRGDVSTDLDCGMYTLRPDTRNQRWVFATGEVKPGLRFSVGLAGTDPFSLVYVDSIPLLAQRGFPRSGAEAFGAVKARVVRAVSDRRYADAYEVLDFLGEVDLYDIVDELWLDEPGVVNELLLKCGEVLKTKQFDVPRILRALEAFAVDRRKLYVDAFDQCLVHPASFGRDEIRERLGKTNIRLVFTYALMPERAVMIYADDIHDSAAQREERPQYGEGGLLYPRYCTAATTPRMHAAKQVKIREIESQNIQFFTTAWSAVEHVMSFTVMASGLLAQTMPAVPAARRPARPVTDAVSRQPGRWVPDFEGGLNMTEDAAQYQARVCHTDRGWGYHRNGYNFDGFDQGTLIDAKYYPDTNGMSKALAKNSYWAGNHHLEKAARQMKAAAGLPIEWRVSGRVAASKLQELFRVNRVPIKVVYLP